MKELRKVELEDHDIFKPVDIENAIFKLQKNKAVGIDGIASEHFMYASKNSSCIS